MAHQRILEKSFIRGSRRLAGESSTHPDLVSNPRARRSGKVDALVADLTELRRKEPFLHAVVFTLHNKHLEAIVAALNGLYVAGTESGPNKTKQFETYGVSGATALAKRHGVIRSFQKEEKKAKVMVIAMRIGNCGITLTAATRVYLMEPCVDPGGFSSFMYRYILHESC
jgi:hypothetical protein